MWQEVIVGLCVLCAAAFVLRRYLFAGKSSNTCGGCKGCGNSNKACSK